MDEILRKDLANLNRRYLYLIRQLFTNKQEAVLLGFENAIIEQISCMTIEELDLLAESMPVPCFTFDKTALEIFIKSDKLKRCAFITNRRLTNVSG